MLLSFGWTSKSKFIRFVTEKTWAEIATWRSKLSGLKHGFQHGPGYIGYVGEKLSGSVTFNRS
jgi:hypothetical protein